MTLAQRTFAEIEVRRPRIVRVVIRELRKHNKARAAKGKRRRIP